MGRVKLAVAAGVALAEPVIGGQVGQAQRVRAEQAG
jgi:hypothetical protein